jgi:hypothetical protein
MMLASLRGDQAEAAPLIEAAIVRAAAGGQGFAVAYAHWVAAILANGLGRYEEALAAARHVSGDTFTLHISMWALPELVEAAVRRGNTEVAAGALERLAETTQAGGTNFGLGLEARCRALLSGGAAADELYREAIDRLSRTQLGPELARAYCCTGSGCAARAGASTRAGSCAPRTTSSPRWGWRRSPGADRHRREGAEARL